MIVFQYSSVEGLTSFDEDVDIFWMVFFHYVIFFWLNNYDVVVVVLSYVLVYRFLNLKLAVEIVVSLWLYS